MKKLTWMLLFFIAPHAQAYLNAEDYEEVAEAFPLAQLSAHVYRDDACVLGRTVTEENYHCIDFLDDPSSRTCRGSAGFYAAAYENDDQVAIVYRGTQDACDWTDNVSQRATESLPLQYDAADDFYELIRNQTDKPIVLAGHSLGGGMAQYVATQRNVPAYIFNAAGLHPSRVGNGTDVHLFVGRVYHEDEPGAMDYIVGTGHQIDTDPIDIRIGAPRSMLGFGERLLTLHSMDNVVSGMVVALDPDLLLGQTIATSQQCGLTDLEFSNLPLHLPSQRPPDQQASNRNFILDSIVYVDGEISGTSFIRHPADGAVEVFDQQGVRQHVAKLAGHRPLPESAWGFFVSNQQNLYRQFSDAYSCSVRDIFSHRCDYRDAAHSQATEFRAALPEGGHARFSKSSDAAKAYFWVGLFFDFLAEAGIELSAEDYGAIERAAMDGYILAVRDAAAQQSFPSREQIISYVAEFARQAASEVTLQRTIGPRALAQLAEEGITGLLGTAFLSAKLMTWSVAWQDSQNAIHRCDTTIIVRFSEAVESTGIRGPVVEGAEISLILDQSGSMREAVTRADRRQAGTRLDVAKNALRAFVQALNDRDHVSINSFSTGAQTQLTMTEGLIGSLGGSLERSLGQIRIGGGTNIGAGLNQGLQQFSSTGTEKFALLLSDGENTTGSFDPAVQAYRQRGIPVCTIGFGTLAGEPQLRSIAQATGCTYSFANEDNLIAVYQQMGAYAQNRSLVLATSDLLAADAEVTYPMEVNRESESLRIYSSWGGSRLRILLKDPNGREFDESSSSHFKSGPSFQVFEIANPTPGAWTLTADWAVPPVMPEQVNINITEKNEIFLRLGGLRPSYKVGERVTFELEAKEVLNRQKSDLKNVLVQVVINKPQEEMVRMVQARSSSWTMFKDVIQDVVRRVDLHADAQGVYSGSFAETDVNGPFVYEVNISGTRGNGETLTRSITGSFQVGSILNNPVKTGEVMMFQERTVPKEIDLDELLSDDGIYDLDAELDDDDALDSLNDLLQ